MAITNFSRWSSRKLLAVLFTLAISPASLVTASASGNVSVSAYFYLGFVPISSQTQSPRLLTQNNSTRALVLNATTFLAEPFSLTQLITFGTDSRTRLVLFATNIDVPVGGNPPALTADAEDSHHSVYPLQVEHVDRLGVSEPTFAIHVRLNDAMVEDGDVLLRLYFNGVPSNRVRVGLGHVGGGLADDGASQITQLSPSSVTAGGNPFTLSITGSGFTPDAKPFFNGIEHAATVASESLLLVPLSASEVQTAGTYSVHVQTTAGVSNSLSFNVNNVNNPRPAITGLSPSNVIKGGSGFTLSVSGSGFVQGSAVRFNGTSRVTAFVSATLLTAQILASDIAGAGSFPITVVNAAPGGGTSAAIPLAVLDPTPSPTPSPTPPPSGVISYATAIGRLALAPSKTAYYRFSETGGTNIADSSGGSHTGTLSGPARLNQTSLLTGDSNPSALLDGGNMVSRDFMPVLRTGLSMACLFQPTAWSVSSRYLIIGTGETNATGLFQLYYQNTTNVFSYSFTDTTGAVVTRAFPTLVGTQQLDRTYHLAVTHDFASKTVKLYLDGSLVSTQTHPLTTPRTTINQPVQVGFDGVYGYIDEALVTGDRVLTDTEVRSLARAAVGADQGATEFYVSPTGTYRASGAINAPIDAYTAFRTGLAAPGQKYVWRGGTYHTPTSPLIGFTVYSNGTSGSPIYHKEYPGERAIIDQVNGNHGVVPGVIGPGTTIYGNYVELWDMEFTDTYDGGNNRVEYRPTAIIVYGTHVKLIGLWIYDCGQAVLALDSATDLEVHGGLFFNNGAWVNEAPFPRNSGHNIYVQNDDITNRKLFKNTVIWGAADFGFHAYGQNGRVSGIDVDGLVSFENGVWHSTTTVSPNIGFVPTKRMTSNMVKNSVAYSKSDGTNYSIGRNGDPHEEFTFSNNKSFGQGNVSFVDYAHVTFSNNLFVDTRRGTPAWYFTFQRPRDYSGLAPTNDNYDVDHAYTYGGHKGDWRGTGNTYAGPGYSSTTKIWKENNVADYNLASWQSLTNIDFNATIRNTTTNPYTTPMVYSFPNTYAMGRGFIAVFNPAARPTATVNLSSFGLVNGQAFFIYDVQNPFGSAVLTGTYNATNPTVALSMMGTTVRAPLGYAIAGMASNRTGPEFKTFMILPSRNIP